MCIDHFYKSNEFLNLSTENYMVRHSKLRDIAMEHFSSYYIFINIHGLFCINFNLMS